MAVCYDELHNLCDVGIQCLLAKHMVAVWQILIRGLPEPSFVL